MANKKKTLHKLEFEPEFNFVLLGLVSAEKNYKLSWIINSGCGLNLVRQEDIKIDAYNKANNVFNLFSYEDENTYLKYNLIQNKSGINYLITELKNLDYLLQIMGDCTDKDVTLLIQKLKLLSEISSVLKIEPKTLKSRNNLIF